MHNAKHLYQIFSGKHGCIVKFPGENLLYSHILQLWKTSVSDSSGKHGCIVRFSGGKICNPAKHLLGKHSLFPRGRPGPEVIKKISCSTQLSMEFFLLINVKMPTIVGILTFMSRKNKILGLYDPEKC